MYDYIQTKQDRCHTNKIGDLNQVTIETVYQNVVFIEKSEVRHRAIQNW